MTTPEEMVDMVQGADLRLKDMFRAASTYQLARDFIKMHRIRGAEEIYTNFAIRENALELVEALCGVLGYYGDEPPANPD
ncbi:MAG: hypothetical protein MUP21_05925 [Dehalococcoidia bacterium]|nr:hypothetical protein [Dehalococcoidia bacterium]